MQFDALVLLGCRVGQTKLSGAAARRVERAVEAYRAGLAPRVVVTGGRRWLGALEADALAAALEEHGVPREALELEREAQTTSENARNTARLLLPVGARSIGVVSCDWHLPRALYSFRRAGFDAVGLGTPAPALSPGRRLLRSLREHVAWLHDRAAARGW